VSSWRRYRYRAYPTESQAQALEQVFGCVRFVFNQTLALQCERVSHGKHLLNYVETSAYLTHLKRQPEYSWLRTGSCVPLQQALRHLDSAFRNRRVRGLAGRPAFRLKRGWQRAEFTRSAFRWRGPRTLSLAKLGALKIRWSRPIPEGLLPSTVTVSRDPAGRFFISLLVEQEVPHYPPLVSTVGIDRGLAWLAVLSTGEQIRNPRHFAHRQAALARAQRRLAKKQRGSKNRYKQLRRVARLYTRITDARQDHLHKMTTKIVRENQVLSIEALPVRNLIRNRRLSKAIGDASWGEITRQLRYKCAWYGRTLVEVDRFFPSSKLCSACGFLLRNIDLRVRAWKCPGCGAEHDRDLNAAHNLRAYALGLGIGFPAAGHAVAACGGLVRLTRIIRASAQPDEAGTVRSADTWQPVSSPSLRRGMSNCCSSSVDGDDLAGDE
jgi:putative transposase